MRRLTGRTIARLAGLSHAGAGKVLTQLVEHALRHDPIAVDDPAWRAQLDDAASQVERWTCNPLSWIEFDTTTLTQMITNLEPLIGALHRDAHWLIAPTPPVRTALAMPVRSA